MHHNLPEQTVSQISASIKQVVEQNFSYVRIRGEISGAKLAPSGHLYLTLKDENANLASVCWRGTVNTLKVKPEDGLEVICTGRITTYGGQSKYQLVIERMEPAGLGALMALFEQRKKALAAEGLFDESRKKPLPYFPQKIGVITSETGAVIKDILHRIEERFPTHIQLYSVLVQGEHAKDQIVQAIRYFNTQPKDAQPDLLILARGGGSIEDLWAFNEEEVVRAIAANTIPLISAIGHETDTTLSDYVADRRAPTPTAAAEMATPVRAELNAALNEYNLRVTQSITHYLTRKNEHLTLLGRSIPKPRMILDEKTQRLDHLTLRLTQSLPRLIEQKQQALALHTARLTLPTTQLAHHQERITRLTERGMRALTHQLDNKTQKLTLLAKLLESLHYKKPLERGFVLVRDDKGELVKQAKELAAGDRLNLEFCDGMQDVIVDS